MSEGPDEVQPISLPELYDALIEYLAETEQFDTEAGLADLHRWIDEEGK